MLFRPSCELYNFLKKKNVNLMKKIATVIFSFLLVVSALNAQTQTVPADTFSYPEKSSLPKPYHPEENAQKKMTELMKQANASHKNIFIQAGGNWCSWCLRFNYFVHNQAELNTILDKNYLYYHLNMRSAHVSYQNNNLKFVL